MMKMSDELMERRARILEAWMDRVLECQSRSDTMEFWGVGTVIDSKGTLRMTAFAPNSWDQLWELESKVGEQVAFTRAGT